MPIIHLLGDYLIPGKIDEIIEIERKRDRALKKGVFLRIVSVIKGVLFLQSPLIKGGFLRIVSLIKGGAFPSIPPFLRGVRGDQETVANID
jgi:hypothetical protein